MNPNDAVIQLLWASAQGMRGKPERGMAAAALAYRLNPRHPLWYDSNLGRLHFLLGHFGRSRGASRKAEVGRTLHFLLGHFGEAAALLEKRRWDAPARNLRDMGWRVAAYGHLGRLEEAARWGEELVREIAFHWRGDPAAGPSEYMDWIVWSSLLEHDADMERLRAGLRLAGLST